MNLRLPFTTSYSAIGLDVGTTSTKAVQLLRGKNGQWASARAIRLPRASASVTLDHSEAELLADVLERQGFSGREVIVTASASALLVDVLDLPPRTSGAPIEAMAADEVARNHKLEPDTFCVAVWDLPAGQRGSAGASAMSATLKHEDAEAILQSLESTGMIVAAIDTQASALARACAESTGASGEIRAILDIGSSAATLLLLVDGRVIYQRRLPDGGTSSLIALLGRELRLSVDEAEVLLRDLGVGSGTSHGPAASRVRGIVLRHVESLNDEIEAGLQYARHRHPGTPFGELMLAGGGATINGIVALLGSRLSVAARALVPPVLQPADASSAAFAQAVGAALHGGF